MKQFWTKHIYALFTALCRTAPASKHGEYVKINFLTKFLPLSVFSRILLILPMYGFSTIASTIGTSFKIFGPRRLSRSPNIIAGISVLFLLCWRFFCFFLCRLVCHFISPPVDYYHYYILYISNINIRQIKSFINRL